MSNFSDLPNEILIDILDRLSIENLKKIVCCSRTFHHISRVFLMLLALSRIPQANYHCFQSEGAIVGYVALVEYDVKNLGIPLDTTVSRDAKIDQVLWTGPVIMQFMGHDVQVMLGIYSGHDKDAMYRPCPGRDRDAA
ncbi:---NA--- [Olea europaea subsp. europaea]|uniref:---NA n=1 Tax=Olea europaea subsp. europaea TaxID=158383 RepID=A0A8S0RZM2_OLEEU|nr:---NA--- [Olea europaea subsp. europaea]